MTPFQLDASAKAPWTSTTVGVVSSDMRTPFDQADPVTIARGAAARARVSPGCRTRGYVDQLRTVRPLRRQPDAYAVPWRERDHAELGRLKARGSRFQALADLLEHAVENHPHLHQGEARA